MGRGVNTGVKNREALLLKVGDHARKKVFLVLDVNEHFNACTVLRNPRAHHGVGKARCPGQFLGVPGNVFGAVAQEVNDV